MTIEQIILLFKDVAARHKQINGFVVSEDYNLGTVDETQFPLLAIVPTNPNLPRDENGFTMFTMDFEIKVLDLVNEDLDNKINVYSDSVEILKDIVSEFSTHPYYHELSLDIVSDASMEKLDGFTDMDLYGYGTELTLASPNKFSFCGSPITNLNGFNFAPPVALITDGNTVHEIPAGGSYTCAPVAAKSGINYSRAEPLDENTSYHIGDYADHRSRGTYLYTPPTNPVSTAQLDFSSVRPLITLLYNNEFGNLTRFTDINGLQVYADNYVIDHLTGYGIGTIEMSAKTYDLQLDAAEASTLNGFTDWRMINVKEALGFMSFDTSGVAFDYAPFNWEKFTKYWLNGSRLDGDAATWAQVLQPGIGGLARFTKTNPFLSLQIRNHY